MHIALDQALYGYDRGHRLIAASTTIDAESGRTLRSVTDLKVGSPSHSYLTVLPLSSMRRHAFIRTWSAGPGFRPGSVWSHVLLMRRDDMDDLADFRSVLYRFLRPRVASDTDLPNLRTQYEMPLKLEPGVFEQHETPSIKVALQLVAAAYATAVSAEVVLERADECDELLLSLFGQMWPELRHTFGLRTRHRRTGSTVATFAIEVVERASARGPSSSPPVGTWGDVLGRDLQAPDAELRDWLRHFGPEGPTDRRAVVPLVLIFDAARVGDTSDVIGHVLAAYPAPEQMGSLKSELFGESTSMVRFSKWPVSEEKRLPLAFRASSALDLDQLHVAGRLTALARDDAPRLLGVLKHVEWDTLEQAGRDSLIAALAQGLEPGFLATIAASWRDLTVPLLSARPDLWHQREVWSDQITADAVRTLLAEASDDAQAATLRGLVATGQNGPAIELCEHHPALWWSLLSVESPAELSSSDAAAITRAILSQITANAVGPPPFALTAPNQLELLASVTDPDDGLWKRADATAWLDVVERARDDSWNGTKSELLNSQVIALAAAEASRDLRLREATWRTVFGDMHQYMASFGAPNGAQRTLDRILPNGPKWDWCGRLREGLARVAVDGGWVPGRIQTVAMGAGAFTDDVARRVRKRTDHKNAGILEGLKSLFRL